MIQIKTYDQDKNFIYDSWLRNFKNQCDYQKKIPKDLYYTEYKKIIISIVDKSHILSACLKDDPMVVLGYIVYEPNTLHYAFVKKAFRKFGIFNALFKESSLNSSFQFTHYTYTVDYIKHKFPNAKFNPYLKGE